MGWVRIDDAIFANRKVVNAGKDGALLYIAGLTFSAAQLTDGHLTEAEARSVAGQVNVPAAKTIKVLVDVGLWLRTDTGYLTPDYLEYNPSGEAERERKAKDRERKRQARTRGSGNAGRDTGGRFGPKVSRPPDVRTDVHPDGGTESTSPSAKCPPLPVPPLTSSSSSTSLVRADVGADGAAPEEEPRAIPINRTAVLDATWARLADHDARVFTDDGGVIRKRSAWIESAIETRRRAHERQAAAELAQRPGLAAEQLAEILDPACGPDDGGAARARQQEAETQARIAALNGHIDGSTS